VIPNLTKILAGDSFVTDLLGTAPVRIYKWGEAPQKVEYPYAVWQVIAGVPGNFIAGAPKSDRLMIQFDVYARSDTACEACAIAIRVALDPYGLWLRYGNTVRDTETRAYRISMDISVFNKLDRPLIITGSYGPVTRGVAYVGGPLSVSGGFGAIRFSTESNLFGLALDPKTSVISGLTSESSVGTINHQLSVIATDRRGNTATHSQLWQFSGGGGGV